MVRVLLCYVSVGSGHQVAAEAIQEGLYFLYGDASEVFCIDPLVELWESAPALLSTLQTASLLVAPHIYDRFWRTGGGQDLVKRLVNINLLKDQMVRLVKVTQPDVIITTHALATNLVGSVLGGCDARSIFTAAVITDFGVHPYWPQENVDYYFVAHKDLQSGLSKLGIGRERICVTGIPILPHFSEPLPVHLRAKLSLGQQPTLLLIAGGQRLGPYVHSQFLLKRIVTQLDQLDQDFQLVVIVGANSVLYKHLLSYTAQLQHLVIPLEVVDNMHEWMQIADILISKPGGLTMAEALSKGLPIVILPPGPGQEIANSQFLLQRGVAVTTSVNNVADAVSQLLQNPVQLAAMQKAAQSLGQPRAALDIAKQVFDLVTRSKIRVSGV